MSYSRIAQYVLSSVQDSWSSLIHFSGVPSDRDYDRLLESSESLVVQRTADRRPFRAVIECLQNLQRHADRDAAIDFRLDARCVAGEPQFYISIVNVVRAEEEAHVKNWLALHQEWQDQFSSTDEMEEVWRGAHRNALNNSTGTPRGGAGLGWLSLARFSVRPPLIRLLKEEGGQRLFFSVEVACCS
jgi:hypothetical protein